ncbi:MAG TPA: DUF2796 domain-containing protein [Pseudomonadales bacterium]|nr:DUF2796 domain-containing protein [Pseudomonadales bacterium]
MSGLLALAFMLETSASLPERLSAMQPGSAVIQMTVAGNHVVLEARGRNEKAFANCSDDNNGCPEQLQPLTKAENYVKFNEKAGCTQTGSSAQAQRKNVRKGPKLGVELSASNNSGQQYSSVPKDTFFESRIELSCKDAGKLGIAEFNLFSAFPGIKTAEVHISTDQRNINENLSSLRNRVLISQ